MVLSLLVVLFLSFEGVRARLRSTLGDLRDDELDRFDLLALLSRLLLALVLLVSSLVTTLGPLVFLAALSLDGERDDDLDLDGWRVEGLRDRVVEALSVDLARLAGAAALDWAGAESEAPSVVFCLALEDLVDMFLFV